MYLANLCKYYLFHAYGYFLCLLSLRTVCFFYIRQNIYKDKFVRPRRICFCDKTQAINRIVGYFRVIHSALPVRCVFLFQYPHNKLNFTGR